MKISKFANLIDILINFTFLIIKLFLLVFANHVCYCKKFLKIQ